MKRNHLEDLFRYTYITVSFILDHTSMTTITPENETISSLQSQIRKLQIKMIKMEDRMKTMESQLLSQSNSFATMTKQYTDSMSVGSGKSSSECMFEDNLTFLNKHFNIDHGESFASIQEVIRTSVFITQDEILDIIHDNLRFNTLVLNWLLDINSKYKFLHAFARDKSRIYMYNFDDLIWNELRNKDIIQVYGWVEHRLMGSFSKMISNDMNFMQQIFEDMGKMYDHNIQRDVSSFRKQLVEQLLQN